MLEGSWVGGPTRKLYRGPHKPLTLRFNFILANQRGREIRSTVHAFPNRDARENVLSLEVSPVAF